MAEPRRCRGCEVKEAGKASLDGTEGRGVYITLIRNEEVLRADS